ncbi:MAG TPA: MFS transporter [Clostridiaceae bacterium]|nr:MFS transporter [Clostridiaceae bacterium]
MEIKTNKIQKTNAGIINLSRNPIVAKYPKMPLEIATLFFWFSLYTYPSIFSPYLKELKIDTGAIGIILSSYGLAQVIFRIPIGIFSDKLKDRKSFVIAGIIFSVISALGLLLFKHPVLIYISRLLAGVAASSWVVFSVLYSSYYKQGDSSKAISRIFIFQNAGNMAAMFIGGVIAESFGWEASFVAAGIAALIALLMAVFVKDDSKELTNTKLPEKKDESINSNYEAINSNCRPDAWSNGNSKTSTITIKELISVINNRVLLTVSFLAILMQFNNTATVTGFTPLHAEAIGANKFQLGLLTLFSQLPGIFASIIGSKGVYIKIGEKKTLTIAFFLTAVFSGVIPLVKTMEMLYFTQFLNGFFRGILIPVLMGLGIKNVEPAKRATAMGAFQAIYAIGMVAGPAVFGFISQATEMWVGFLSAGFISLIGSIVALTALKH